MNVKLTRRQAQFVAHLIDLNRDQDGPIHYSVLAEDLGVSPFTAYDMLRLLEDKGLVTSVYQLPEDKSGPGRAERVFYATEKGREHRRRVLAQASGTAVPTSLPAHKTADLCAGEPLAAALTAELLGRVGAYPAPARYGLELVALVGRRLVDTARRDKFAALVTAVLPPDRPAPPDRLALLGGALLGFLAATEADTDWLAELAAPAAAYQVHVLALPQVEAQQLAADISTAVALVMARFASPAAEKTTQAGSARGAAALKE